MNDKFPLVVANHKANKTWEEILLWLNQVGPAAESFTGSVVLCPSFPHLAAASLEITKGNLKVKLGSQDISRFEQGAYTGEVAASQIADIVDFVIIGHSERRDKFGETDRQLSAKVQNAQKVGIDSIFCVQTDNDLIPEGVNIIAYEPVSAIGTGNADNPDNVIKVSKALKAKNEYRVLYGGSVSADNVKSYHDTDEVDGFLIGATNSLDPQKFIQILNALK